MRRGAIGLWTLAWLPSQAGAFDGKARLESATTNPIITLRAEGPVGVLIRGGTFTMGSDVVAVIGAYEACTQEPQRERCRQNMFADELAEHQVSLGDFWLDRTEVTNAAYGRCVEAAVCAIRPNEGARAWTARGDTPATLVTWSEAVTYCQWVGARLPTEAEWERAARGWADRRYPWGDIFNPHICNHGRFALDTASLDASDGFAELAPVGSFPQGRTLEGIDDLAGNAEEWVSDWYAPGYPEREQWDPHGPEVGDHRVVRGGSFQSGQAWLRATARAHDLPSSRRAWRGFRCARGTQ